MPWPRALGVCVESGFPGVVILNHKAATVSGAGGHAVCIDKRADGLFLC